ncbi:MAG: endonuclease/exonuclease/phosphatase family protein, partial [Campylobacterota bacterium]|nr:endonuclease/exonuclease/phosphatase family protein [Campylobacterota bacterium]
MRVLIVFLLLFCFTEAKEFTIASYNVQNLFDLKTDGTEYKQYNPKINKNWNKNSQKIKLNNVKKVLADLDANIIALQEIESKQALKDLLQLLPQYPYHAFLKNSQSAVGLALLSKFPIETSKKISIQTHKNYSRPILEVSIRIDNRLFYVFINHWRSKKAPESFRIDYANSLKNRLKELPAKIDYIVLGDLNSNYNERETLKFDKKLNDTFGITGINDVLMDPLMLINLWHELPYSKRFSYRYKGQNTTPDHIVVTKNLFDNQGISYVDNSFKVFKPYYLYKNKKITSWKFEKLTRHEKIHGYSDHLPIIATFSTQPFVKKNFSQKKNTIEYLYT